MKIKISAVDGLSGQLAGKAPNSNFTSSTPGLVPASGGGTTLFLRADGTFAAPPSGGGSGTVTSFAFTNANGITGTVSNASSTPTLSLSLGAITPTSIVSSGNVTAPAFVISNGSLGILSNSGMLNIGNNNGVVLVHSGNRLTTSATGVSIGGTLASSGNLTAPNHLTTFMTFCSGKPAASEVIGGQIMPVATTFVQANCVAKATVAATASTVFTIKKDGTNVGTITFAASATLGTISITSGAIAANQNVTIEAPATADATLANISFLVRA